MNKKLRILSLFSGIGAFEKALSNLQVNFELVNYCEVDKYASKAYSMLHNVKECCNIGDINSVNEKLLSDFDLMTYGFPCQSFSIAGNKLGFEDKERGNLFFESMRIAAYKQPSFMIAENVKGLLHHDKGRTFKTVLDTLEKIGYNNYYQVLNSCDYGVAQSRERIFIVSIRKDIDTKQFEFPNKQKLDKTVVDILDNTERNRYIDKTLLQYCTQEYLKEYKGRNGIKKLFDGNSQGYFSSDYAGKRIYSIHGNAPTLTTRGKITFFEIQGQLNELELFRLQGFEDEDYYKLKNCFSKTQLRKMAGNSITVNVIEKILENLLTAQSYISK